MNIQISHFKYLQKDPAHRHFGFIEVNGVVVHRVENLDEFYEAFGFHQDMRKSGVLPDEFIWDEYIRDSSTKHTECYQLHILEYLTKYSSSFSEEYGEQSEQLIAEYAEQRCSRCTCNLAPCHSLRYKNSPAVN